MKHINFINYSTYSNGYGLLKLEDIVTINKANNSEYAVLTDHMTCMAFPEFNDTCIKNNLKPIFGLSVSIQNEKGNLILIAKDNKGIQSLRNITSSKIKDKQGLSHVTWETIEKESKNLVAISGSEGSILGFKYQDGTLDQGIHNLKKIFSNNNNSLFLDIQKAVTSENDLERTISDKSKEFSLHVIATSTNRSLKSHSIALLKQKLITQIGTKNDQLDWKGLSINDNDFAKTNSYLHNEFKIDQIKTQAMFINNTVKLANAIKPCSVFKKSSFPKPNNKNLREMLREVWPEFSKTIDPNDHALYKKRIASELNIIEELDFEDYFKTYASMAEHAKENNVGFAIRGSGSSSLVVHALGISGIDPVKNGFLFERFLNKKRVADGALPDIDFDTSDQSSISKHLSTVFGADNIATLTNTNSIQKSNVSLSLVKKGFANHGNIKDMSGFETAFKNINSLITTGKYGKALSIEMDNNKRLQNAYAKDAQIKFIVDSALDMEGQITIHSRNGASLIVSDKPIRDSLSISKNKEALVDNIAEISKDYAEKVGFIKLDVLSVHCVGYNLKAYQHLGMINELHSEVYDDENVFKMFQDGNCFSLFQMTSLGMNLAKDLKPNKFSDIVVLMGLIRPGVPQSEIASFIDNKNNGSQMEFIVPELEPLLSPTYGVIIFEEQLMQIAQDIGGFSPDQSDELRRTIKSKDKAKLQVIRKHFVKKGLLKNDQYKEEQLNAIFDKIESKADGYMFSKAHATVYADICYKQAKVKSNFPGEYASFYLANEKTEKKQKYINELIERGIYFNSPNINKVSNVSSTVATFQKNIETKGIMPSLNDVVGEHFSNIILKERLNGPFEGLLDFTSRTVNKYLETEKTNIFDLHDGISSPQLTMIKKHIAGLSSLGFFDNFISANNVNDIVNYRNHCVANIDQALEYTLSPYIEGDFKFNEPTQSLPLEHYIEIEKRHFGLSSLNIFKNEPIKIDDLEKKRPKKGSLYNLI
jgi:DNA polymerase-3 subunit alpha